MKSAILIALLIVVFSLLMPGCSQNIIDRGDVFPAVEQTISQPGPVRDDLIARGLVTLSSPSDSTGSPVPGAIKFGEIEQLVNDGIYVIDENGYLQFGPLYTPPEPQPPWPNVKVYNDDSQKIIVNSGDEFIIRYTTDDLFPIIKENHDGTMITLMDRKIENSPITSAQVPSHDWFLFKALRSGETQITIIHFAHELVIAQKIFNVVIN